jgi:NADPH-dependent ferric siderophore reductase
MSSAKGKILRLLAGALLRRVRVSAAEDVAPGFRRITLQGDLPAPAPGSKVQLLLPSDDVRTYSPIATGEAGAFQLLGFTRAGGPGARWCAEVAVGAELSLAGPQRSLDPADGPLIVVGDETGVGVAAAFARARPGRVQAVLQGAAPEALRDAAASVGLKPAHLAERGATAEVVEAVVAARAREPSARVLLTGGSELLLAVRSGLKDRGVKDVGAKTYWVPGREGLD